jgi:hypothetical protein
VIAEPPSEVGAVKATDTLALLAVAVPIVGAPGTASETLRMRWLSVSTMYTLPLLSVATPTGLRRLALVAAPPSPLKP